MRTAVLVNDVINFWNRQPCNIKHGTATPGSPAWSNQVTARKYFVESHIPQFAQFSRWRGKEVLEIGCGIGTDTLQFGRAGAYIDAIDLSDKSIELARTRMPLPQFLNVGLYCMNAEEWLPYADMKPYSEGYDLIYSFGVIHHTPNPEKVVANVFKRLKPGGEFRLMLYARRSIKNLFHQQPEAQEGCPIAHTYTREMVRELLKDFEIKSITQAHIFPWRISDYVKHRYVKEWYYRWMPKWLFSCLERVLGWHLLIVCVKPSK